MPLKPAQETRRQTYPKTHPMNRRTVLRSLAAVGSLPFSAVLGRGQAPPGAGSTARAYRHRCYLGWITDLASSPHPRAAWPSIEINRALLEDYRRQFRLLRDHGFTGITVWGLFVSRNWPVAIEGALDPARARLVEQLVDLAHQHKI